MKDHRQGGPRPANQRTCIVYLRCVYTGARVIVDKFVLRKSTQSAEYAAKELSLLQC